MKYLSPFHILPEGFKIENLSDKKSLKQARKLVLMEFELQEKTTILINNQEYDKDAIIKYFEALEADENLDFHAKIYANQPLLSFLETGKIQYYKAILPTIQNLKYTSDNNGFLDFISPYIANHFNELLATATRKNDKKTLDVLLENEFPLAQKYEVDAYQATYRWYHGKLRNLDSIEERLKNRKFVSSKEIYLLIDLDFIETFNRLPMYFYNIRDQYAFLLYQVVVILNNDLKRTGLASSVVDAGLLIQAEYTTMEYFQAASTIVGEEEKGESKFNWIWIYVIFQALLIFARMSTCSNSSSNNYNYQLEVPTYKYSQKPFEDSLIENISNKYLDDIIEDNQVKKIQLDSLLEIINAKEY